MMEDCLKKSELDELATLLVSNLKKNVAEFWREFRWANGEKEPGR